METQTLFTKVKGFFGQKEESDVREAISELIAEDDADNHSSLNEEERELFTNILDLQGITVEDVMAPRADMVGIPLDSTYPDILKILQKSNFSRFPIFVETLDDIRGFVHIKDILIQGASQKFELRPLLNKTLYVPTSMPVMDLLSRMRQEKTPIAIVVDEFGGTDGLVTAWDILLKILGEMSSDSQGDQQAKLITEEEGAYVCDARLPIEELEEALDIDFMTDKEDEEIDTVGGLVLYLAGRVPNRKEIIEHPAGYEFEVLEATPRALGTIRVLKTKEKSEGEEA